jgi:hypothetical protein
MGMDRGITDLGLRRTPDDTIAYLQSELDQARETIIRLMPEEIQHLFHSYWHCKSKIDTYRWEANLIEQIIKRSIIIPTPNSYFNDRAQCPLCGAESSSLYERGFAVPEGLRRHLGGSGNTSRCNVMHAGLALARNYWDIQESKWNAEEKALTNKRRDSETLFVTSYMGSPQLIDSGLHFNPVRTPESLALAEKRLIKIGFLIHSKGRVRSYTLEKDNFLIFADPRSERHIEFIIYKKPLPTDDNRLSTGDHNRFRFYDHWTVNLREKFERQLTKIIELGLLSE